MLTYPDIPPYLTYLSSNIIRNNDGTYCIVNKFRDLKQRVWTFTVPCVVIRSAVLPSLSFDVDTMNVSDIVPIDDYCVLPVYDGDNAKLFTFTVEEEI